MNKNMIFLLVVLSFLCTNVHTARILGVFPVPSLSHQVVFRALTLELIKNGHEVVVATANPAFADATQRPKNLTEIDTSFLYQKWMHVMISENKPKRGVVIPISEIRTEDYKIITEFASELFDYPEMQTLIRDKKQHFDLIISEALFYTPLLLAKIYNAPCIWFSSFYAMEYNLEAVGAPIHRILYPNLYRSNIHNLSVWEKIYELYIEYKIWHAYKGISHIELEYMQKNFDEAPKELSELLDYVDLVFINAQPIFDGNRPVPPNLVYLGSLHMQPVKALLEDLKSYLDSSTTGVVYVSFGSNVSPESMDPDLLDAFLDAFEVLPYDVLWKFGNAKFTRKIPNLRIGEWFPQRDLLTHPNIKAFVTQGGLQSTDEAIDAEVPLVGIPMFADQGYNVAHYVKLGIGVKIDPLTLTSDDLVKGVKTVIGDNRYRENMRKLKRVMQDQPQKPLERAVWWTEFVLRHRGAKFLRSPTANIPWTDYYQTDVLLVLVIALMSCITVIYLVFRTFFKILWKLLVPSKIKRS